MNGLALGIVEAVHGVDAGEHAESVAADDGEEELERHGIVLKIIFIFRARFALSGLRCRP